MEHHRYENWLFSKAKPNYTYYEWVSTQMWWWWQKTSQLYRPWWAINANVAVGVWSEVREKDVKRAFHLVFYANIFLFTFGTNETKKKKWKLQHSLHSIDNDLMEPVWYLVTVPILNSEKSLSKSCIHIISWINRNREYYSEFRRLFVTKQK